MPNNMSNVDESVPLLQQDDVSPDDDLVESISYAVNSFTAVLKPISITMLLASIVVSNIESGTDEASFTAFDTESGSSDTNTLRFEKSVANSLIIVAVLATATFAIVCLYKFRFMKVLIGYMMFSSMSLLGVMGGVLALTVLETYSIPCDALTFYIGCYNFAVVGVISIFYKEGVPTVITQAYLVFTAVLMAWQLSKFEEWTGWTLLVTLAFYDLCAVLTPCGPLKALVNLMQEYNEPMPGLLYEAELERENVVDKGLTKNDLLSRGIDMKVNQEDPLQSYQLNSEEFDSRSDDSGSDGDDNHNRSIKLGLGDFVFYAVLVSRASLNGFTAGVICYLVVVLGLGATLVLLSVYRVALPALPISICLGVLFYVLSVLIVTPFLESISGIPIYF